MTRVYVTRGMVKWSNDITSRYLSHASVGPDCGPPYASLNIPVYTSRFLSTLINPRKLANIQRNYKTSGLSWGAIFMQVIIKLSCRGKQFIESFRASKNIYFHPFFFQFYGFTSIFISCKSFNVPPFLFPSPSALVFWFVVSFGEV